MTRPLLDVDLLRELLGTMLARGGDFAEVYAERRSTTSLRIDDRRIEEVAAGEDAGAALRIVDDERALFASTNRMDPEGLLDAGRRLAAALDGTARVEPARFREPTAQAPLPIERPPSGVPLEEKVEALAAADRGARRHDPRVTQFTGRYGDSEQQVQVANSEGALEEDRRVYTTLHCNAVARQGADHRTGIEVVSEMRGFELFDRVSPYKVGAEAGRLAALQLDAKPAPAGTFTVVLSSAAGGTMVHEACGHGLEGDFVKKGLSAYAGRVGQKVAADVISVVDDGTLDYKRGSGRIDDEGTPTRRVTLIEDGVLRGYLHSRKSAQELELARTGNARRSRACATR